MRHAAVRIAEGSAERVRIGADDLSAILGPPRFEDEVAMRTSVPGVAACARVPSASSAASCPPEAVGTRTTPISWPAAKSRTTRSTLSENSRKNGRNGMYSANGTGRCLV